MTKTYCRVLSLAAILVALAGCGSDGGTDSRLFFGGPPPRDLGRELLAAPRARWELVHQWGTLEGEGAFSLINDIAVSRDSLLAVADRHSCSVVLIDIRSDSTWSIGRCGDGPDEFQEVSALDFVGSELWVYDRARFRLVAVEPRVGEVRVVPPLEHSLSEGGAVRNVAPGGAGALVLGLQLLPTRSASDRQLVALVDRTSGDVLDRFVTDARMTSETQFAWGPGVRLCGTGQSWAVVNEWTPQVRVYDTSSRRMTSNLLLPAEWFAPVDEEDEPTRDPGMMTAPYPGARIACSETFMAVSHRFWWREIGGPLKVVHSRLVFLDREGHILMADEAEYPSPESPLAFSLGAVLGDMIFFFTSRFYDYPVVRAYRVFRGAKG